MTLPLFDGLPPSYRVTTGRKCKCRHTIFVTAPGRGPHANELLCGHCHRHCGWLSGDAAAFVVSVIEKFGEPTAPIEVRVGRQP
jgi:hypothetical protein